MEIILHLQQDPLRLLRLLRLLKKRLPKNKVVVQRGLAKGDHH
jgi:hypothetical protein